LAIKYNRREGVKPRTRELDTKNRLKERPYVRE
jgi:hypothetical protein